ncbi:MAG: hypothetical protein Q9170_002975 [Blastenia crenularia]
MATTSELIFAHLKAEDLTWGARWGSIAICEQLVNIQEGIDALSNPGEIKTVKKRDQLVPIASPYHEQQVPSDSTQKQKYEVGIVGSDCAGLFMAIIFNHLKDIYEPDIEYDILESNDETRLGGRLYTHYFSDQKRNLHDYYNVGAMRFPGSKVMSRQTDKKPDMIIGEQIKRFIDRLKSVPAGGWKLLMEHDEHSVRQWLLDRPDP